MSADPCQLEGRYRGAIEGFALVYDEAAHAYRRRFGDEAAGRATWTAEEVRAHLARGVWTQEAEELPPSSGHHMRAYRREEAERRWRS